MSCFYNANDTQGLQGVINTAQSITWERRKITGQTMSRSGRTRISSIASAVPWNFTVKPRPRMKYSQTRELLESLDTLDLSIPTTINIGANNTNLSYITEYQGVWTPAQLDQITFTSPSGLNFTLDVSGVPNKTFGDVVFRKGDFIQPGAPITGSYRYPYTVTDTVTWSSGGTITVPVNRPFIPDAQGNPTGRSLTFGSDVTWSVVMVSKPSYRISGYDILDFTDDFRFVEVIV
ncbi:MAG: hypothetical protein GY886_01825 [Gammaproteobacteria bacterium]|nr:hypothetical protein [Gammaproteobacteria bacterium]